jgi:peptidoglycan/xylan/chitin deacetylase (PgdA/CDA1 family)
MYNINHTNKGKSSQKPKPPKITADVTKKITKKTINSANSIIVSRTAKAVCITFADNYQGFYKYAWPILKKKRIPVAQFVHTDFVGNTSGRPKMTWRQLTELDRSGLVTIGSQTCSHPEDLTKLSDARLRHEMADSKRVLEQRLGHAVTSIAYPNGKYDTRVSRAAREANYLIGFTEVTQSAEKRPDIYRVPRYVHTKYKRAILENFGKS